MGKKYSDTHEVAYYECDINQTMTFPAMISAAIKVSSDQSDQLKRGTEYINQLGITWVITQTEVVITRLPRLGEVVTITTEPTAFNKFFCYRSYWLQDETGAELVKINLSFSLMTIKQRKISSVDTALMAPFEAEHIKKIHRWSKIDKVQQGKSQMYHVRFYDLDGNHHVNNAIYFNWLIDVLGYDFMVGHTPTYANVRFDKEVLYGTDVESLYDVVQEDPHLRTRHRVSFEGQVACEANILWEKNSVK